MASRLRPGCSGYRSGRHWASHTSPCQPASYGRGPVTRLINQLTAAGLLSARIAGELPLSAAAQAHEQMEAGQVRGRLLLRP